LTRVLTTLPKIIVRFEKLVNLVSGWLNWVTVTGLVAMSLITVVDVIGSKAFRSPLVWSYDVTGLLGLVVLVFALAFTQMNHGHIEIEFVTTRLPMRAQTVINAVVALLGTALFAVMTWQMAGHAITLQRSGRVTSIGDIPLAPFGYAAAFCFLAIFLTLVLQFFQALIKVARK
jgi:TRAP-type C4-dicarboxylate transport system permease small subunit